VVAFGQREERQDSPLFRCVERPAFQSMHAAQIVGVLDARATAEAPQEVIIGPGPPQCIERPSYPYCAINVGVIVVRNSPRLLPLLEAWIREMDSVQHLSIEQTALANLIYRLAPDFFEAHYRKHELVLGGRERASVMAPPMQLYNFTKLRRSDTSLRAEAFVALFCGGKRRAALGMGASNDRGSAPQRRRSLTAE
jgi:hypothetical protein